MITIAIVNDYEVVVQGLAAMLRSYQDRMAIVELDTRENVGEPVDITLYDTFASADGDLDEIRLLSANPRAGKVVVYSWNLDPAVVSAALAQGASAYLSKSLTAHDLAEALRDIHAGDRDVTARSLARRRTPVGGDWPGREEGLTHREAEILALITQGLSNAEVADRVHLSHNTVKTYIRSCYRRIGVTNRANAIIWGVDHGFRPDRARIRELPDIT